MENKTSGPQSGRLRDYQLKTVCLPKNVGWDYMLPVETFANKVLKNLGDQCPFYESIKEPK